MILQRIKTEKTPSITQFPKIQKSYLTHRSNLPRFPYRRNWTVRLAMNFHLVPMTPTWEVNTIIQSCHPVTRKTILHVTPLELQFSTVEFDRLSF